VPSVFHSDDFIRTRLRALRKKTGLSQEGFAEHAKFSYKYYQGIEAGRRVNLRIHTIETLARGFGLTLSEFFSKDFVDPRLKKKTLNPPHKARKNTPKR
jgi:transcriptional regulator with XRE-family HTH domain